MSQQAIDKFRAEMASHANNQYVQVVGTFLIGHVTEHPEDAPLLVSSDKTILKSLEAMRKEAEKKKVGNCAVLTDAEGFAIVLNYFKSAAPTPTPKEAQNAKSDDKPKKEPPKRQESPQETVDEEDEIDFDSLLL